MTERLPVIDMSPLFADGDEAARRRVAIEIDRACRDMGFFYVTGHRVAPELPARLEAASWRLF